MVLLVCRGRERREGGVRGGGESGRGMERNGERGE